MSLEILAQTLRHEALAIDGLASKLNNSHSTAIDWILECKGRVIACGIGKSGHIAKKTAGTLSSTGTPSLFLHAGEALHGDLGMVTASDVVLMYSHSGESDELVRLFPALQTIGAKVILMTGRPQSSAGRLADLVIETFVTDEACPNNLAPTTSTTAMLALSDALAVAVMVRRKFSKDDFAKFHPSGALGKRLLLKVGDVMRTGADVSIVRPETTAIEVMKSITHAGAGASIVADEGKAILGLITDGDLRRHFLQHTNPFETPANELMTPSPSTLPSDLLAVEALEYFQNLPRKIGEVPIATDGKVEGLLVLKDLLRSGIL